MADQADTSAALRIARPAPSARAPGRQRMRVRAALLGAALLLLAAGLSALWWSRHRVPVPHYVTQAVTRGAIVRAVTATGTVNPELTIIVGSYVSGVIQSLSCDYNTEVKAGQVCAKIDPRPF